MFGKKEKVNVPNELPPLPPIMSPDQQIAQQFQQFQPMQPVYQPVYQQAPQIQQVQLPQKKAVIIKGETNEPNEYFYVVQTNYPLALGVCDLRNL